jgi:hypothetical protein
MDKGKKLKQNTKKAAKKDKLAEALRRNLLRRKQAIAKKE